MLSTKKMCNITKQLLACNMHKKWGSNHIPGWPSCLYNLLSFWFLKFGFEKMLHMGVWKDCPIVST